MDDIFEIRRKNLQAVLKMKVITKLNRELDRAEKLGMSKSMWSQVRTPTYRMGEEMARGIERVLGLDENWMDNVHGDRAPSQAVGRDLVKMAHAVAGLITAFRDRGEPFIPENEAELLELTYGWLQGSPDNVSRINEFATGLVRGRHVGQREDGSVVEEAGREARRKVAG